MKKYSNPHVEILYLLSEDIMQSSGENTGSSAFDTFSGDGVQSMLPGWEGLI